MRDAALRVAIIDDHPVVRAGIRAILAAMAGLHVVAEGATGRDALSVTREHAPDVLVLDVNLPDMNGLEVTRSLRRQGIQTPIVILTAYNDDQTVLGLLEAGATGYVLKDEALDRLAGAVIAAARGHTWLSPEIAGALVDAAVGRARDQARSTAEGSAPNQVHGHEPAGRRPADQLTPREREILSLLAQGLDNDAIARRLVLTKRTVQNHISVIYDKLEVTSRTEALLYAVKHGLVRMPLTGER
jgi:DNA-binding NarL/FixJ family response regulator